MKELFIPGYYEATRLYQADGTNFGSSEQGPKILTVVKYFEEREYGSKPIPAKEQLITRLSELTQGREVPVVLFNCLDLNWKEARGNYPASIFSNDTDTSNTKFFEDDLIDVSGQLQTLGSPSTSIIIPDSELFDDRVFNFGQSFRERAVLADEVKKELNEKLQIAQELTDCKIQLWSEYCKEQGISSPFDYTAKNYARIQDDPEFRKKVIGQARDSKKYLAKKGLPEKYVQSLSDKEFIQRIGWYCAMYAGEGEALADSKAIVVNFEDQRVTAWFQRGANNTLPIVTPVDPTKYYKWRNSKAI